MTTPENIKELKPNEVFVFGSNLAGNHAGGAARYAAEHFGAEDGIGEGMTGQTYAFPTLTGEFKQLGMQRLYEAAEKLYETCELHPEKTFYLTKVGCGIAGYPEDSMQELFAADMPNLVKPEGW